MIDYKEKYNSYLNIFEDYLKEQISKFNGHNKLVEAMKYSLLAGGKRVREVLMLSTAVDLGVDIKRVLPYAFALECIHTYSLIHDDLPALDNDDLRRGKPTLHKAFGEDIAILAGDALLNYSIEHLLEKINSNSDVKAMKILFECSGYKGMLGGQANDLLPQLDNEKEQMLLTHTLKTSRLISAPLAIPAILAQVDSEIYFEIGRLLGIIYQLVDDLLDATSSAEKMGKATQKDIESGKLSGVKIFGLEGLKNQILTYEKDCATLISRLKNNTFLLEFLKQSTMRLY